MFRREEMVCYLTRLSLFFIFTDSISFIFLLNKFGQTTLAKAWLVAASLFSIVIGT